MPSFAIEIREKNVRVDGKFHVAIRLIHNRKNVLLPTGVYVSKKQIEKDFTSLTDARLRRQLSNVKKLMVHFNGLRFMILFRPLIGLFFNSGSRFTPVNLRPEVEKQAR